MGTERALFELVVLTKVVLLLVLPAALVGWVIGRYLAWLDLFTHHSPKPVWYMAVTMGLAVGIGALLAWDVIVHGANLDNHVLTAIVGLAMLAAGLAPWERVRPGPEGPTGPAGETGDVGQKGPRGKPGKPAADIEK